MANSIFSILEYNSGLGYEKNDVVLSNAIHYYALTNVPPNNPPPNSQYWGGRTVFKGESKTKWLWNLSYSSPANHTPRLKSIQFGDGYEQRNRDGINNNLIEYDVQFNLLTYKESFAILHFLYERGGTESFVWIPPPPYATEKLFVCKDWRHLEIYTDNNSINGRFLERVN